MELEKLNPFVRFARVKEHTIPHNTSHGILQAVDHRIFYCCGGEGNLEINGIIYPFTAGTLIYLPAGTPYRFFFKDVIPVFSGCNFDFYQDHNDLSAPIPPVLQTEFHKQDILEKQILEQDTPFSHCIYMEHMYPFDRYFTEIAEEYVNHNLYYDLRCSLLLKDVLISIVRIAASEQQGINRQKADDILQYIHEHDDLPLTNKEIAKHFNYHENYISTLILKYTGLTLHQYVLNHKMNTAVSLLQSTTLTVGEVAEKVGMPNIKHFSMCFKKVMGHAPSQFKKR